MLLLYLQLVPMAPDESSSDGQTLRARLPTEPQAGRRSATPMSADDSSSCGRYQILVGLYACPFHSCGDLFGTDWGRILQYFEGVESILVAYLQGFSPTPPPLYHCQENVTMDISQHNYCNYLGNYLRMPRINVLFALVTAWKVLWMLRHNTNTPK